MSRSTVLAVTLVTVSVSAPHVVVRTDCPAPPVARAEAVAPAPSAVAPPAARRAAPPGGPSRP